MTPHGRRSAALWCGIGVLATITLGAPVAGAIASFFWATDVVDARSDDERAAERLADRVSPPKMGMSAMGETAVKSLHVADCIRKVPDRRSSIADFTPNRGILLDIMGSWDTRDAAVTRGAKVWVLRKMPHALLGALDKCVAASLLAPMCVQRVRHELERHDTAMQADVTAEHMNSLKRANAEICALAAMAKQNTASTPRQGAPQ